MDIGAFELYYGEVHGLKFHDRNGDGVQAGDGSEPGLAGWTIYADLDNDGVLDNDEPRTVALSDGTYLLTGVPPGTQTLREIADPDWRQTLPRDDFSESVIEAVNPITTYATGGDLDNDGVDDLIFISADADTVSVSFGNGDRSFTPAVHYSLPANPEPYAVEAADLDGDGDLDVVVGANPSSSVFLLTNTGDGTLGTPISVPAGTNPARLATGDFDNDGDLDLVVNNSDAGVKVLLNNGTGNFGAPTTVATAGIGSFVTADLNGDGHLDAAAAETNGYVHIFLNQRDATFAASKTPVTWTAPNGLSANDLDGDGDIDLATANGKALTLEIYLNNGDGTFANAQGYSAGNGVIALASADVDQDGDIDFFVANYESDDMTVMYNQGDGTFVTGPNYPVANQPVSAWTGDFDGDDHPDAVFAYNSNVVTIRFNDFGIHSIELLPGQTLADKDFANRFNNEPPVLADTDVRAWFPFNADVAADRGTLVSNLIGGITDEDVGALTGIAVTAINETDGTVQYSIDDGATWTDIGAVSESAALLLAADDDTRIRFRHDGGFAGTAINDLVTFRAWDQTSGTAGQTFDTTVNGLNTAFSTATDTLTATFTAVYWDGGGDGTTWNDAANWFGDAVPATTDDVLIDVAADATIVNAGAGIRVNGLQVAERLSFTGGSLTVTGPAHAAGELTFTAAASLLAEGALADFTLTAPGTFADGNLSATGGARLGLATLPGYSAVGTNSIVASGANSRIDLSGATTVDGPQGVPCSQCGIFSLSVSATDGGVIDLSGTTEILDQVFVTATGTGSVVDLSSLTSFDVRTDIGGSLEVSSGGQILAPVLDTVSRANLKASGGATLDLSNVSTYTSPNGSRQISATGAGSVVDLTGATTFSGPTGVPCHMCGIYQNVVSATDGGRVELDTLESITNQVKLTADGANSVVDLPSLTSLDGVSDIGAVVEQIGSGLVNLPSLDTIGRTSLLASGGTQLNLASATSYSSIDGSLDIRATGSGTRIDMSGVTTVVGPVGVPCHMCGIYSMDVEAEDGGVIDLSAATNAQHQIRFETSGSGSEIDMSSMATLDRGTVDSLRITAGDSTTIKLGTGNVAATGVVLTKSTNGTLSAGTIELLTGSSFAGSGTIDAGVVNSGSISPGSSPGILAIDGDYTQTSGGALNVELGGLAAGLGYDKLVVTGHVSLDGTLNISTSGGFTPRRGFTFQIVAAGSVSGQFATVNGQNTGDGFGQVPVYNATDATLRTVFHVENTDDTIDADPGDGNVADAGGNATLRAAIMEANAIAGDDSIILPAGTYALGIAGAAEDNAETGDLDIKENLTIVGAGAGTTTIDAAGLDRVFHVLAGVTLDQSGVTVTGGSVTGGAPGGGLRNAGGTLNVTDSVVTNNSADLGGGGIHSAGSLNVTRSTISTNTVSGGGGGIYTASGTASVTDSTISDNTDDSAYGGGIYIDDGTVTIANSTFSDNEAALGGGNLANHTGTVTIDSSTFSGGVAPDGGGMHNAEGAVAIANSTFADNTASGNGGAIFVDGATGSLTIASTTISGNSSGGASVTVNAGSASIAGSTITANTTGGMVGGVQNVGGTVDVRNTIIAGTVFGNPDVDGAFTSQGHNLIGVVFNATGFGAAGDQVGTLASPVMANLGPLADNGGSTQTHALMSNSPAIDAGDNAGVAATDQRGVPRILDGDVDGTATVDIGAFEYIPGYYVDSAADAPDATPGDGTAADESGNTTLRAAVMEANALAGPQTIFLPAGTYKLSIAGMGEDIATTGDLDITDDLTLIGGGADVTIIDADQIDRAFQISTGKTVQISDVTITRGMVAGTEEGGGIFNQGSLTVSRSVVSASSAYLGGGISSDDASELVVQDAALLNCMATEHGGGIMSHAAQVTIVAAELRNNQAGTYGGGVYQRGTWDVRDSVFQGNRAADSGGAFYSRGTATIQGSTFSGNTAHGSGGGGIFVNDKGVTTLTNATVSGNTTAGAGGGICVAGGGSLVLRSATVISNQADEIGGVFNNGSMTLSNTIIALNTTATLTPDLGTNRNGTFTSGGHNFIGDGSIATSLQDGVNGDQVGTAASPIDPLLEPLQDNNGPTLTHAPLRGSPVIDAGSNIGAPPTDQRGALRVADGNGDGVATADIGAVEFGFLVNTTEDTIDANPGDGLAQDANGNTSLRAAVMEANATAGDDAIILSAGIYTLGIAGAGEDAAETGDLDITDTGGALAITGAGADQTTIDADGIDRAFHILAGATFHMAGVTVTGGDAGSIEGGGILNAGTLTLHHSTLSGNSGVRGGGLYNSGVATIDDSVFSGNSAFGTNGGGAGFASPGTLTLTDSRVEANNGKYGGAIRNMGGTITISGSTIADNSSSYTGGGLHIEGGQITITGSTISDNRTNNGAGGGIEFTNNAVLIIADSTFSNNYAHGDGGAIAGWGNELTITGSTFVSNDAADYGGALSIGAPTTINNSTFSGNTARERGAISTGAAMSIANCTVTANSAGIYVTGGDTSVKNSIIAANTGDDVTGAFTSLGHNLIGDVGTATGFTHGVNGDQVGTSVSPIDPLVGPLADNGGPTFTHALLPSSPAIDSGDNTGAPATDQRGAPRVADGDADGTATVDIGAVEFGFFVDSGHDTVDANPGDGTVADSSGDQTLRAAIMEANARAGHDTIFVAAGTYTLAIAGTGEDGALTGDLDVTDDLTIVGAGSGVTTIDGGQLDRVLDVPSGVTLNFSGVTITRGRMPNAVPGGGIRNVGTLTVADSAFTNNSAEDPGGAIGNTGTLTVTNSTFTQNAVTRSAGDIGGGAIGNEGSGTVTVAGSTFTNNSAVSVGGAIFNVGDTMVIAGSTFSSNTGSGGAIDNEGNASLTITDSVFSNNISDGANGAIVISSGVVTITRSTITGNEALNEYGGGITNQTAGDLTIIDSTISNNQAKRGGGGIWNRGTLTVSRSTISDNTVTDANGRGGGLLTTGTANIDNTTVSGNVAGESGGGIDNRDGGVLTITSSTVVENTADKGGGIRNFTTVNVRNTIVAGNTATISDPDVANAFNSQGHNLIGDVGAATGFADGVDGDQVGNSGSPIDPMLGPLAAGGGPTQTHVPLRGSPVIDAGTNDGVPATDQRGGVRTVDGDGDGVATTDIGAVEYGFFVNTTDDTIDADPGDGLALDANGKTSLRAAVMEANASVGYDAIILPAGTYTLAIAGTGEDAAATGDLDIRDTVGSLTIIGSGAGSTTIDAGSIDRVFQVHTGVTFQIGSVTVTGGSLTNGSNGGGFLNAGILRVSDSIVRDNQLAGSAFVSGGAIYNQNSLTMTNSEFLNNVAGYGGAIGNADNASVSIADSTFTNNGAGKNGGALDNGGGTVDIVGSTFSGNSASSGNSGGALNNRGDGAMTIATSTITGNTGQGAGGIRNVETATLAIVDSTLSENTVSASGGAIINGNDGIVSITNSTISGNQAGTVGGAIRNADNGVVTLVHSTVTANSAASSGGGIHNTGTLNLDHTILAGNTAPTGPDGHNVGGTVESQGHNLVGSNTDFSFTAALGDQVGTVGSEIDPMLGPLQDNGGPTFTHAVLAGSPVIDAGNSDGVAATDQRGAPRRLDGDGNGTAIADIGAFEYMPASFFFVDSFDDTVDANPGDGTVADANGNATLRAAVMEANALAGEQTIVLAEGTYGFEIAGTDEDAAATGDLDITDDLEIVGVGAGLSVIDGNGLDRVLETRANAAFRLSSVTVQGGHADGSTRGGGILVGGPLTVLDSEFSENSASRTGGAIRFDVGQPAIIRNSTFHDNTAVHHGGAIDIYHADVVLEDVAAWNNRANQESGGAVMVQNGSLTIRDSRFTQNRAFHTGGAVSLYGAVLRVEGSTFDSNQATRGGAFYFYNGTPTIINSTMSGNVATRGGAVYDSQGNNVRGDRWIVNCTIVNNSAPDGSGILAADPGAVLYLQNTIVANNTGSTGDIQDEFAGLSGSIVSKGHNLIGDAGAVASFADGVNGDIVGSSGSSIDPLLGPLQDNGGPTQTHALLSGSPAIEAGIATGAPATDQRGAPRSMDGDGDSIAAVDIGAYEAFVGPFFFVDSFEDTVDANPGDGTVADANGNRTLRAAIIEANALAGAQTIVLAGGTHELSITGVAEDLSATGDLDVTSELIILGAGADSTVVDFNGLDRVFHVHAGAVVNISDIAITGGNAQPGPTTADDDGGAMSSAGNVTVTNSVITDNRAAGGGGAFVNSGNLSLFDSVVSDNTGLTVGGGVRNLGTVQIVRSTLSGNSATQAGADGGAISNYDGATLTITDSALSGNFAEDKGGAILNDVNASVTIVNSTLSDNTAQAGAGGAIRNWGPLTITNSTITENTSPLGGGISHGGGTATLKNTIVAVNTSTTADPDIGGAFTTDGHNLIGDAGGATEFTDGVNGDLVGSSGSEIDPLLGPLQDNGGPTFTHALFPGSPAIDGGDNAGAPATDQRGVPRVTDGDGDGTATVDIGAVERFSGQISGLKFHDRNGDGVQAQDGTEPGLPGWTIYLDLDGNGALDTGEPSTVTQLDGTYTLAGVPAGTYLVAEVAQAGWQQTSPRQVSFGPQRESSPGNTDPLVIGDFDADGDNDLVTGGSGGLSRFMGRGDGSFDSEVVFLADAFVQRIAAADINNDTHLDVLASDLNSNSVRVLLNNGDGTFAESPSVAGANPIMGITTADFDGDDRLDLAFTTDRADGDNVSVAVGNGDGTFAAPVSYTAGWRRGAPIAADLDGDGHVDLAVSNSDDRVLYRLRNKGDGTFEDAIHGGHSYNFAVAAADWNDDGHVDLAVANGSPRGVKIYVNNGDGTYNSGTEYATQGTPNTMTIADFNGDGVLDLAFTKISTNNSYHGTAIMPGDGDGTFGPEVNIAPGTYPSDVAAGDLNGDGLLDVVTTRSSPRTLSIAMNRLGTHSLTMYAGEILNDLDFGNQFINAAPVLADTDVQALLPLGADASVDRGTLVLNLTGGITDADAGAREGIAVTVTNEDHGIVQYSTDDGATWTDVGAVDESNALLLAADTQTRVRFRPNVGFTDPVSDLIAFRAWDQTQGSVGDKFDTTVNGLNTAFSTATDTLAVTLTSVFWDGGGDGTSWSDAANWSDDTLPSPGDDVLIDVAGDITVVHPSGDTTIQALHGEETFSITGGSLAVTGWSRINAAFTMSAGTGLMADGLEAEFTATGATTIHGAGLNAINGGLLSLPALTDYTHASAAHQTHYFRAQGSGSLLDLPNLTTITGSTEQGAYLQIEASGGGQINLSSVAAIIGPVGREPSPRGIQVSADGAGSIVDLSGLVEFSDTGRNTGSSLSHSNGGQVLADNLTTMSGVTLAVSGGETLRLPSLQTYAHGATGGHSVNYLKAEGAGSLLDLPSLQTISGSTENDTYLHIQALAGGRVSLPNVTSMIGVVGREPGPRGIQVWADGADSIVDLSGLTEFSDTGRNTGSSLSHSNGGRVLADSLTTMRGVTLTVSGGETLSLPSLTTYAHGATGSYSTNDFTAQGAGSLLDLPSLESITGSTEEQTHLRIRALEGGRINLSNVKTIEGMRGRDAGPRGIQLLADGSDSFVDLAGLTHFIDDGTNPGSTISTSDGGQIDLGNRAATISNVDLAIGSDSIVAGIFALTSGSSLQGEGTIQGSLTSSAPIQPGTSPGILTIDGDYTQTASGVLNVEVGGLTAGTQHDQLAITGRATLGGTLNVTWTDGFEPASGDTIPILTYDSASGDFATITGLDPGTGTPVDAFDAGPQYVLALDPGSISGTIFHDQDRSGSKEGGESGLEGWTVYLDLNDNGVLDAGEPTAVSQAGDGTPRFDNAFALTNSSFNDARGIATDAAGNVYLTGRFKGTVDFDPGAGTAERSSAGGSDDIFVAKYTGAGSLDWVHAFGSTGYEDPRAITVDGAGNVYVTGAFRDAVDFDPGGGVTNLASAGDSDVFLLKWDTDGVHQWVLSFGGTGTDGAASVAVDGAGNPWFSMYFNDEADLDPTAAANLVTPVGGYDAALLKLDSSGDVLWARTFGDTGNDYLQYLAFDALGNVHASGNFDGTVDFDPDAGEFDLTSPANSDIFVLKLAQRQDGYYEFPQVSPGDYTVRQAPQLGWRQWAPAAQAGHDVSVTAGLDVVDKDFGNAENRPPSAADDAVSTDEDTSLTIAEATLLGNDTDADPDALHVLAVSPTSEHGGTVSLWVPTGSSPAQHPQAGGYCGSDILDMIATNDGQLITGHYSQRFRSVDFGQTWENIFQHGPLCRPSTGFSKNDDGRIFLSYNETAIVADDNFQQLLQGPSADATGVNYATGDGLFFQTDNGWDLYRHSDNEGFVFLGSPAVKAALGDRDGYLWAADGNGRLLRSTEPADPGTGQLTFQQVGASDGLQTPLIVTRDGGLLITDADGDLWRSPDSGASFTEIATRANFTGGGADVSDIIELSDGRLMVGTSTGQLRQSADGGQTWLLTGNVGARVVAVTEAAPARIFATTPRGVFEFNENAVQITYSPPADFDGEDTFTYTIYDGNGGTATATVTMTINAVNDPPTLDPIADPAAIPESSPEQTIDLAGITAGGGEDQQLQVTATSDNQTLVPDGDITVTYTSPETTGTVAYTPVADVNGTAVITVTVRDAGLDGVPGNGDDLEVSQQFTVEVLHDGRGHGGGGR